MTYSRYGFCSVDKKNIQGKTLDIAIFVHNQIWLVQIWVKKYVKEKSSFL